MAELSPASLSIRKPFVPSRSDKFDVGRKPIGVSENNITCARIGIASARASKRARDDQVVEAIPIHVSSGRDRAAGAASSLSADPEPVRAIKRGHVEFRAKIFRLTKNDIARAIRLDRKRSDYYVVKSVAVHVSDGGD